MFFLNIFFAFVFVVSANISAAQLHLPDLRKFLSIAQNSPGGSVEVAVGLRPLIEDGVDVRWNNQVFEGNRSFRTFTAVGMGGAGITLMPGVSELFLDHLKHEPKDTPIVIVGAGFIGIGTAWHAMRAGFKNITIIAERFPRGAEDISPSLSGLTPADNYPSRVGGGWLMPVSVIKHTDPEVWKQLMIASQSGWLKIQSDPMYRLGILQMPSYVFTDTDSTASPEDKSGIKAVNKTLGRQFFPSEKYTGSIFAIDLNGQPFVRSADGAVVEKFTGILQVDTLSVLKKMYTQLVEGGAKMVQKKLIDKSDLNKLLHNQNTIVMNATGNGSPQIFDSKLYTPVRGDLVIIRVPKASLSSYDLKSLGASLWMGRHYLFVRNDIENKYAEIILGGTFLKGDGSLEPRPETSVEILGTWLKMLHSVQPLSELLPSNLNDIPCSQAFAFSVLSRKLLNQGATNMGQPLDF